MRDIYSKYPIWSILIALMENFENPNEAERKIKHVIKTFKKSMNKKI